MCCDTTVKTMLLVAVMFARMKGGCSMSEWVVMTLFTTWRAGSVASLQLFGAVIRLKITSRSAIRQGFGRTVSFQAFLLFTSVNSLGCFSATCT